MCREAIGAPFSYDEKQALYKRAGGKCEHPQGCQERNLDRLTIDHLTPQCVGKLLGWTLEQQDDWTNLSLLCREHHIQKDRPTEQIKKVINAQLHGAIISHRLEHGHLRFYKRGKQL